MNLAKLFYTVAWLGVATSQLSGQPPKFPEIKPFAIDGLRLMLQHQGLETIQTGVGAALEDSPRDTVIVMLGDFSLVPRFSRQIDRFVGNGGSLLMASDLRGTNVKQTNILGVWVKSTGNVRGSRAYRGFRDCPIVTEFDRGVEPSLFAGVETVIANRPGELTFAESSVRPIAWLPARGSRQRPVLMSYHRQDRGRMLFVADHSMFTNQMLVHGDNARFVKNVSDWLCADGTRKKLVIIHDGRVLPAWGLGETPPPIPLSSLLRAVQRGGLQDLPIGDSVLPVLNASIADLQQKDELNNYVRKVSSRLLGRRPIRIVLLLVTALVVVSFLRLIWGTRSRPRGWLCLQDWSHPVEGMLGGAVNEKQYQGVLRSLSREFFVESGLRDWNLSGEPTVHLEGSATAFPVQREVRKIWKVATASSRRRMSKRQFDKTLNRLKYLRELQRLGDLSLEWP